MQELVWISHTYINTALSQSQSYMFFFKFLSLKSSVPAYSIQNAYDIQTPWIIRANLCNYPSPLTSTQQFIASFRTLLTMLHTSLVVGKASLEASAGPSGHTPPPGSGHRHRPDRAASRRGHHSGRPVNSSPPLPSPPHLSPPVPPHLSITQISIPGPDPGPSHLASPVHPHLSLAMSQLHHLPSH